MRIFIVLNLMIAIVMATFGAMAWIGPEHPVWVISIGIIGVNTFVGVLFIDSRM